MKYSHTVIASLLGLTLVTPALADAHMTPAANALVTGTEGALAGSVTLNRTASEMVLVEIDLTGVPEGVHGVHLHETGDCSAPDYTSAGGHIAGDRKHGVLTAGGPHPGDMPNMTIGDDGVLKAEVFLPHLDLDKMIMDDDGAAFIVHSDPDDYSSQPSGEAGSRIACGTFSVIQ